MRPSLTDPRTTTLSPAVVGAALADIDPVRPSHMHLIARALGRREPEASALTLRLFAAAELFNDRRWPPTWLRFYKTAPTDRRRAFDAVLVFFIARMELDARCRFPADQFSDGLLDTFAASRPT